MGILGFNKWLGIVNLIAPVVLANVKGGAKIAPFIPVITQGIGEAEQIPGATGADKKAHVLGLVDAAVTALNQTGKVKLDPTEVNAVASTGVDQAVGIIKIVHGLNPTGIGTAVPPVVPPAPPSDPGSV